MTDTTGMGPIAQSLLPKPRKMLQPTKDEQRSTISQLADAKSQAELRAERETVARIQADRFVRVVLLAMPVAFLAALALGYVVGKFT